MAVTPALPSPRTAAGEEGRQRKDSTAAAAGSCTLPGMGFVLPKCRRKRLSCRFVRSALQAPLCLSLAIVFKALLQNSFVGFSIIIAVSGWFSHYRLYFFSASYAH